MNPFIVFIIGARRLFAPPFWVCEWQSTGGGDVRYSGTFAVYGNTAMERAKDVTEYMNKKSLPVGDYEYIVRRPNLYERVFGHSKL